MDNNYSSLQNTLFHNIPSHLKERIGFSRYGEHNNLYCTDCKTYYCQHVHIFRNMFFSAYEEKLIHNKYIGYNDTHSNHLKSNCIICQGHEPVFINANSLAHLTNLLILKRKSELLYFDSEETIPSFKEKRRNYISKQQQFKKIRR